MFNTLVISMLQILQSVCVTDLPTVRVQYLS